MNSNLIILVINCFGLISSQIIFEDLTLFPDYGYPSFHTTKDIRQRFLKNRKVNDETAKRVQLLDKYLLNNTVYVDDIVHYEIDKKLSRSKKANAIETEFRNLIGMRGLKYTYKRDTFWRTWRKVHYPGKDSVICYRCENTVNFTNCQYGGFWVIEEKSPPCPYEFFSISKEDKICAVHINQYHDVRNSCTSEINLGELTGACNNPVVTEWHIQRKYNDKVSERFPTVICGGRESCSISTLYKVATDYISFGIVNAANDVIYSRIMKRGKKNYACIKDCGKMDPTSKTISKADKSLVINLIDNKNKKEGNVIHRNKLRIN